MQTTVLYSGYSAGRDEKLFPNPMKFDPERWKRDETHAFAIQPFGFGPRACYGKIHAWTSSIPVVYLLSFIGRRFAELELKLLLAQVGYSMTYSSGANNNSDINF